MDVGGDPVEVVIEPGENVWIENADATGEPWEFTVGSLYLSRDGRTLSLGRYSEDAGGWEVENDLPVPE